jgi:hypothetical protein
MLRSIRRRVLPLTREGEGPGGLPTFEWLFNEKAVVAAEQFAYRAGLLEPCRNRGVGGLLKIRSIRMAVAVSLSLIYAVAFENWKPRPSDSRDVLHATAAVAAADVFVTHDSPLRDQLLARIPVPNFRTLRLPDLLDKVRND